MRFASLRVEKQGQQNANAHGKADPFQIGSIIQEAEDSDSDGDVKSESSEDASDESSDLAKSDKSSDSND